MRTLQYLLIGTLLAGTGITGCGTITHDARDSSVHALALGAPRPPTRLGATRTPRPRLHEIPRTTRARSDADGRIPDGVYLSAFDPASSAVTRLDPALRSALQKATTQARGDGVVLGINSGWRSRSYQQDLLDQAVRKYGSLDAALHWVSLPGSSHHVTGRAVDIGPSGAASWLEANGAPYGLCRVYANEPWHFELRTQAVEGGPCPPMYPDSASDPDLAH